MVRRREAAVGKRIKHTNGKEQQRQQQRSSIVWLWFRFLAAAAAAAVNSQHNITVNYGKSWDAPAVSAESRNYRTGVRAGVSRRHRRCYLSVTPVVLGIVQMLPHMVCRADSCGQRVSSQPFSFTSRNRDNVMVKDRVISLIKRISIGDIVRVGVLIAKGNAGGAVPIRSICAMQAQMCVCVCVCE